MNILTDNLKVDMQNSPKNMPKFQDWLETRDLNEGLFAKAGKWAGGYYGATYGRGMGGKIGAFLGGAAGGTAGTFSLPIIGSLAGTAVGAKVGSLVGQGAGIVGGGYLGGKAGERTGAKIDAKFANVAKLFGKAGNKAGNFLNQVTGGKFINDPSVRAAGKSTREAEKQIKGLSRKNPEYKPVLKDQQNVSNKLTATAAGRPPV